MLIGIDGFEASVSQRVGVGRLAVELIKHLYRIDRKNSYRVYVPDSGQGQTLQLQTDLPKESAGWKYRLVPLTRLWSQVTLPLYLYFDKPKPDVFLSPVHYAPRFCPSPSVIFVFDLSYIHFPDMFKKRDLYKLVNWTRYSVKRASKVLTISKASKADIIKEYNVDSKKVKVVYPGINLKAQSSKFKVQNEMRDILSKYGVNSDYILYVGTLQPRKNLVRLIDAFKKLKVQSAKRKTIDKKLKLVIVGKKGWMYEEIFNRVKQLDLEKDVIFTGFVADEELLVFYQKAKCLVLVSLYEGFGLPVLEAMSYGTPVVASNVSSLPEVAGDVGIMVDPNNTDDIAHGILKILSMSDSEYKKLSDKCKKQAKKFSWEKCARETLKILEEITHREK